MLATGDLDGVIVVGGAAKCTQPPTAQTEFDDAASSRKPKRKQRPTAQSESESESIDEIVSMYVPMTIINIVVSFVYSNGVLLF